MDPDDRSELEAIRSTLHAWASSLQGLMLRIDRYLLRRDRKEPPEKEK